jgi:uncharacterized protein YjdB
MDLTSAAGLRNVPIHRDAGFCPKRKSVESGAMNRIIRIALILLLLSGLTACKEQLGEIQLNTVAVSLQSKGATAKLIATVQDVQGRRVSEFSQPIAWSTSDPSVATVDPNGIVKAIGSGSAVVTAALGELTTSAAVNVQIIDVVVIEPNQAHLQVGEQAQFTATVLNDRGQMASLPVTWKTGNAKAVKIDENGLVTAAETGVSIISATAGNRIGKATVAVEELVGTDENKSAGDSPKMTGGYVKKEKK